MNIEIRILVDGNVDIRKVMGEAGFAALVSITYDDSSQFRFLFDTGGGTPALEYNMNLFKDQMGGDWSSIEKIVLSHGHWDHVAGVPKIISMVGKPIPVLCHPDALLHKIFTSDDGKRHDVGIHEFYNEPELETKTEIITTREPYNLSDGVMTTGVVPRTNDYEVLTGNLQKIMIVRDGKETPDQIQDDLSVIMHMKDDSVVILSGCCHSGIVNTIAHSITLTSSSSLIGIIGGLHLHDASKERLANTIDYLEQFPLKIIGVCHCTGLKGLSALIYAFEDSFKRVGAGSVLRFEVKPSE